MKKTDIAMIVLIASVSILASFFVARSVFGDYYAGNAKVKTIDKISSEVVEPDATIFNADAINPAIKVNITETSTTGTQ